MLVELQLESQCGIQKADSPIIKEEPTASVENKDDTDRHSQSGEPVAQETPSDESDEDVEEEENYKLLMKQLDVSRSMTKVLAKVFENYTDVNDENADVETNEPDIRCDTNAASCISTNLFYGSKAKAKDKKPTGLPGQPKLLEGGTMRDYQVDGFQWIIVLYEQGFNGILADEMGLGKTIQSIAVICHLVEKGVPGPFLICGPLSTTTNWMMEIKRFAPKLPCVLYCGNKETRKSLQREIRKKTLIGDTKVQPIVITNYENVIRDRAELSKYRWKFIFVDEGHRIKNRNCKLAQILCSSYHSANRLILTGTPLQNDLAELWSLLHFVLPEIFVNLSAFESWFHASDFQNSDGNEKIIHREKEKHILSTMHEILSPFILRRTKADVKLSIPPKKELKVYCPVTPIQEKLYRATVDKTIADLLRKADDTKVTGKRKRSYNKSYYDLENISDIEEYCEQQAKITENERSPPRKKSRLSHTIQSDGKTASVMTIKMQNPIMQLRKIVNHPYLVQQPVNEEGYAVVTEDIVKSCGKMQVLDALLRELKNRKHRVLLFSQMTQLLNIVEEFLGLRGYNYVRLDGAMDIEVRQEAIDQFNKDESILVFLISTRAGGLGINLTAADTVIIYDSDWNPQADLQAQDRCHRIGQTKPVVIYRLVTANTVDDKIVERAAAKRKLEKLIIGDGRHLKHGLEKQEKKHTNIQEILELLNSRDENMIMRGSNSRNVFTKAELQQLLDRSDMGGAKEELTGVFKVLDTE